MSYTTDLVFVGRIGGVSLVTFYFSVCLFFRFLFFFRNYRNDLKTYLDLVGVEM